MDYKRNYPMVEGTFDQNAINVSSAKLLVTSQFLPPNVLCSLLNMGVDDPLFDTPWEGLYHVRPSHAPVIIDVLKMATAITISDTIAFVKRLCDEEPEDFKPLFDNIKTNNEGGAKMPTTIKKKDGKFQVKIPGGVKAKGTTKAKAESQKRLLDAIDHGFVPDKGKGKGKPAPAKGKGKMGTMGKPVKITAVVVKKTGKPKTEAKGKSKTKAK